MSDGRPLPLDLELDGLEGAVSTYLLPEAEPALVDPGPSTTLDTLRTRLEEVGLGTGDLRHLLLTHVHLDHAGAAGHLVRENPRLRVWLHPGGAPHLADPARLVSSTRRTFTDAHDRLWGEVLPVPSDRIRPLDRLPSPGQPGRLLGARGGAGRSGAGGPGGGVRPVPTPGHIAHHLSWLHEPTGALLAGDALGILLHPEAPVHPPTPPPAVDVPAWLRSLDALAGRDFPLFGAAHFGLHGDLPGRALELADRLRGLERRVRAAEDAGEDQEAAAERYEEEVRREQSAHLPAERVERYFDTFGARTDWEGMVHHVRR